MCILWSLRLLSLLHLSLFSASDHLLTNRTMPHESSQCFDREDDASVFYLCMLDLFFYGGFFPLTYWTSSFCCWRTKNAGKNGFSFRTSPSVLCLLITCSHMEIILIVSASFHGKKKKKKQKIRPGPERMTLCFWRFIQRSFFHGFINL